MRNSIKVIHLISPADVGGANTHVLSLVKELSKNIKVRIISFRPGVFADEGRDMGIDIEVIRTGNILRDISQTIAVIRRGRYDIIHSHGSKANMVSALIKYMVKLPTITTIHSDYRLDYLHSLPKKYSFGIINTIAIRFLDYHISVSRSIKELLIKKGFAPQRIMSLNNSIDFDIQLPTYSREKFTKKYNLNLSSDDIVIGILARLTPIKDIGTFLKAAREVLRESPSIKFVIAGDGEERPALENQARELEISGNVFFIGFINEINEFLANLDINVLTSISEGFPLSIVEGARLKKATISSAVGGIPDLIESGVNGYLFAPGDYKGLAGYMIKLANDDVTRRNMGERIYEKAKMDFSLTTMCNTQLSIYRNMLKHGE